MTNIQKLSIKNKKTTIIIVILGLILASVVLVIKLKPTYNSNSVLTNEKNKYNQESIYKNTNNDVENNLVGNLNYIKNYISKSVIKKQSILKLYILYGKTNNKSKKYNEYSLGRFISNIKRVNRYTSKTVTAINRSNRSLTLENNIISQIIWIIKEHPYDYQSYLNDNRYIIPNISFFISKYNLVNLNHSNNKPGYIFNKLYDINQNNTNLNSMYANTEEATVGILSLRNVAFNIGKTIFSKYSFYSKIISFNKAFNKYQYITTRPNSTIHNNIKNNISDVNPSELSNKNSNNDEYTNSQESLYFNLNRINEINNLKKIISSKSYIPLLVYISGMTILNILSIFPIIIIIRYRNKIKEWNTPVINNTHNNGINVSNVQISEEQRLETTQITNVDRELNKNSTISGTSNSESNDNNKEVNNSLTSEGYTLLQQQKSSANYNSVSSDTNYIDNNTIPIPLEEQLTVMENYVSEFDTETTMDKIYKFVKWMNPKIINFKRSYINNSENSREIVELEARFKIMLKLANEKRDISVDTVKKIENFSIFNNELVRIEKEINKIDLADSKKDLTLLEKYVEFRFDRFDIKQREVQFTDIHKTIINETYDRLVEYVQQKMALARIRLIKEERIKKANYRLIIKDLVKTEKDMQKIYSKDNEHDLDLFLKRARIQITALRNIHKDASLRNEDAFLLRQRWNRMKQELEVAAINQKELIAKVSCLSDDDTHKEVIDSSTKIIQKQLEKSPYHEEKASQPELISMHKLDRSPDDSLNILWAESESNTSHSASEEDSTWHEWDQTDEFKSWEKIIANGELKNERLLARLSSRSDTKNSTILSILSSESDSRNQTAYEESSSEDIEESCSCESSSNSNSDFYPVESNTELVHSKKTFIFTIGDSPTSSTNSLDMLPAQTDDRLLSIVEEVNHFI